MKAAVRWISLLVLLALSLSLPINPAGVVEARPLADAIPGVSLALPTTGMIGEPVTLLLEFDNVHAADVGYGPYMDLFLPLSGPDGLTPPAANDGLTMTGASYLGGSITNQILLCPAGTSVTHPLTGLLVNCPAAPGGFAVPFTWQMVVFTLPFGSFVADQPPATVTITLDMSDYADLGTPLPVLANGGFMFGNDPLNNPATDPAIIGTTVAASITPTLIELVKIYNGPEDETATGPNFPRSYTINIDIAENQIVSNLDIIDELDNNQEYLGFASVTPPPYTVIDLPVMPGPQNPPDNNLDIRLNSVMGGLGTADASLDVLFFIPQYDANGDEVITPETGDDVFSCNNALTVGDWSPLDPRDLGGTDNAVSNPAGCEHNLEDQSIAIQKSVVNLTDANHSPGDILEYTLNIQISDYFAFEGLNVLDTFSDGQLFDTTFSPTLSFIEHGTPTSGDFALTNYTVTRDSPGTGETEVAFNISAELIARALDGQILGGCVPASGTGGGDPDCSIYNGGASVGTITFRTIIQENFTDTYLPGDPSVDQGDILWNDVVVNGNVLNVANLVWNGNTEDDDSHAEVIIARGTLDKSIYALNGITPAPTPVRVSPGDSVTFRLRYTLPNSDFEDFYIIDYLPLPVFDAAEVSGPFNNTVCGIPAAGAACLGPADS
ncbi:MAG: hypothetical protein KA928_04485, partial [Longilinea sp.]|nr:hypothetical protein [Longilinea sp.]